MDFLWQTFEFQHMFILILGLTLGILIGSLPGLTPTMGVALMIPFTFSLGATDGLILLGGIYCGSVFGGSIPAILFNVPGAPANVATTFDGYPMTKKGKARKALELATISSFIGGLFGMILLIFFAPVFAEFSLRFGPTESFWIALFGITVIAAISDGSVTKNLMGGCLGILLSFIGISTITGTARFTFGFDSLIGGLHIVAVLIGLFAFPQALRMLFQLAEPTGYTPNKKQKQAPSTIRQSFADVLKKPKYVSIGSGMGAFIGMIPGAGGNIASILAYNEAKRFSKNKRSYGKGEKNGIIASESANNAMVGGSLIPLLTLGIPGSPTAAIFLGGLLIHGIWPGSNLFVDHADVAYTFLFSMILAQVLILIMGLALIKYMARLTYIPAYLMIPVILSFSIIGAYTTQNNYFDIFTVVFIGLIMFLLQKWNFSAAPIALGFILGTIAEVGLLHGIQLGKAQGSALLYFVSGSWNIILISLIVITVTISIMQAIKSKQQNAEESIRSRVSWRQFVTLRSLVWLLLGALTAGAFYMLSDMRFEQRIFPQITLIFLFLLMIIEYIKSSLSNREETNEKEKLTLTIFLMMVFISLVTLLTNVIGFYLQVFLLTMAVPLFVRMKGWRQLKVRTIILTAVTFTFLLYIVFTVLLKVPLPLFPFL